MTLWQQSLTLVSLNSVRMVLKITILVTPVSRLLIDHNFLRTMLPTFRGVIEFNQLLVGYNGVLIIINVLHENRLNLIVDLRLALCEELGDFTDLLLEEGVTLLRELIRFHSLNYELFLYLSFSALIDR